MIKKIYIAGPLFNVHEKKYLEDIAAVLEEAGYDCFLPHRDQTGIDPDELKGNDMSQSTKDIIFQTDIKALNESDLVVALVTGQDIDSGTASEIGYMYANNKPVIAITAEERRYRNLFTAGMFSSTINNIGDLLGVIKTIDS
ncbi:nucleoside 2-deoxyribosyltransferase [Candidatus Actinomarina]|jgi:nucleoside 2-deoxyribosyltransferase|nr:nucleoside 2-deoxyribosyltransferase [Candidatus Actinomarina sp.]MDC1070790.1 nucleoside 2-deoxyribosyltransferase [Acidimicrobiia bacterium]